MTKPDRYRLHGFVPAPGLCIPASLAVKEPSGLVLFHRPAVAACAGDREMRHALN